MEETNKNLPTLSSSQGLIVTSQTRVADAKNMDIITAIKYVMALLGTPKEKQPSSLEMILIINYLRLYMKDMMVDEIRIAFDLALQKKFPAVLDLYGGTLSMKYISDVLNAYITYKKPILKKIEAPADEPMIGMDRGMAILDIIKQRDPVAYEKLRNTGKPERKPYVAPVFPYHDIHQRWLKQFDELKINWAVPNTGERFINRYGYIMNIEGYFNKKMQQLQLAKFRNADKL